MINRLIVLKSLVAAGLLLGSILSQAAQRKIGILVYDNVLTSDVVAPVEVFGAASKKAWFSGYEVLLVGVEKAKKLVTTEEGLKLRVDTTIYDSPKLDILIVNSAYEMSALFKNKDLRSFLLKQAKNVSWLSSNCSGAFLYAHVGLLDGYKATTWAGGEKQLQKEFPKINVVEDQNVVIDKNRVTTNGGIPSYQGALAILALVTERKRSREIFEAIQLNRLISWNEIIKYLPAK